jgi:signal transduction histidine kinase
VIHIFAKESRLIVIFFLTVIVLGSILVYLGINNISNYQELTEKKILEEERDLAQRFSSDFQSELEGLVATFEGLIQKDSLVNRHWFNNIDTIPEIKQAILINKNGAFEWPHFTFSNNNQKKKYSSLNYIKNIKEAQHYEFVVENYNKAEIYYLLALKMAKSKLDSVHGLNAVSRLYMKMNRYERAFNNYALILSQFSNVTNTTGFPYAYFSVNQLLKISDPTRNEKVQKLLVVFLTELLEGKIPLNFYASDLLSLILKWSTQFERNDSIIKLKALIQDLSDKIVLVNNYKKPIVEIINEASLKNTDQLVGYFNVVKPVLDSANEILLFNTNAENPMGFTIKLEALIEKVKQKQIQNQTKFEYQIELVNAIDQPYFSNNDLSNVFVFSPYFNQHRIKITLKNENVLEDYVFKRKLVYGIGFLLLLGVMTLGLILLVQDIKRKKQMERLRSDFVSNVTHELKTPLTSIHMFAESILLGRVKSDIDLKKYANIIVRESENLKRMINNILEFSRKENNKLVYQIKETNLSDLVNLTIEEMNYWLEINDFKVTIEIEENVFAKIEQEGLRQALSNLISNAIKYSSIQKELIVRLYRKGKRVYIEIEDFGIGIPKDKLILIFEKFYRVNSEENESVSGTGLGLTVTRDIIEAQNGEILVESTLGKGSKFTIVFNV